jgi:hypothetical protein
LRAGNLRSRLALWGDGLKLVRDYGFTGIGSLDTGLVHATSVLLIPWVYAAKIHNAFIQTWVEDGVLGAAALASGAALCLRCAARELKRPTLRPLAMAGVASLGAQAIHGLVDDMFTPKRAGHWADPRSPDAVSDLAPGVLLGVAAGFADLSGTSIGLGRTWIALGAGVTALAAASRSVRSAWHANRAALEETRLVLGEYDPEHFDAPTLDEIRRRVDLSAVDFHLRRALALNPRNRTALQRSALLALSRGHYSCARDHGLACRDAGHRDRITRLVLGDALVAEGKVDEAVAVLRGIPWAAERLDFQAWYRYWCGGDRLRAVHAWTASQALGGLGRPDPGPVSCDREVSGTAPDEASRGSGVEPPRLD